MPKKIDPRTRGKNDPTDLHVGARVRMRRKMLNMSQTNLGDAVDLTFQQIQKYEKGSNRIGSSRLQQFSNILQAPISFFFEGLTSDRPDQVGIPADLVVLFSTTDGLKLAASFQKIKNRSTRRQIVELVEAIASDV